MEVRTELRSYGVRNETEEKSRRVLKSGSIEMELQFRVGQVNAIYTACGLRRIAA